MTNFDNWLAQQVKKRDPCTPTVVQIELEAEYPNGDFSENKIFNCEECDNLECDYWKDFHDTGE